MHRRIDRPQWTDVKIARRVARPQRVVRNAIRSTLPAAQRMAFASPDIEALNGFGLNPYLDYSRSLTADGGILIAFRDYDLRFRHALWGGLAWSLFTWLGSSTLVVNAALFETWGLYCCALALGLANWLIVSKPIEIYRRLEIRPDCMIVDGDEVFWARNMENGWPGLEAASEEEFKFQGVYGSRHVEFFTVRRFDENDRTPELFAGHFKDAVAQLWLTHDVD